MACVEVCPVHAIYADADVPAEFTKDIEFNAVESGRSRTQARGNHSPQRCSAHRERPKKALGISESGTQEQRSKKQQRDFVLVVI
jgi:formate hydrogenlyase subunit 6/NADH:ubiquinone oxidoreductase subunit I